MKSGFQIVGRKRTGKKGPSTTVSKWNFDLGSHPRRKRDVRRKIKVEQKDEGKFKKKAKEGGRSGENEIGEDRKDETPTPPESDGRIFGIDQKG